MQVHDIMTPSVHIADPNMTIREASRWMRDDNVGALPVGEHDRLIGMITDRDIVTRAVAAERSAGNTSVREVMSEGVCYCFEDDDVEGASQVMATHQIRRLPVINRQKRLVGVVALADISRADDECAQDALKDISAPAARERH